MDYCHPCQRHLNGALACPGCGTRVEQLRAYRDAYEPEPYGEAVALADHGAPAVPDGHAGDDDRDGRGGEGDEPHGRAVRRREQGRGGRSGPVTAEGAAYASRRDRKAALHRRRRKRALLIAAGFVLAAGGLSLAELGVDAPGFSSPDSSAAGGEPSEAGRSTAEPSESAKPLGDGAGASGGKSSASPDASASPSASKSADGDATPAPDKATRSAALPGSAGSKPPPASGSAPTSGPTTSGPSPQPSPSETCKRFLWWCA